MTRHTNVIFLMFLSRFWASEYICLCSPLLPIMPYRKISRDLKLAAIRLYEGDILELSDILNCLRISWRPFFRIWKLWNETGYIVNRNISAHGHLWVLAHEDIEYLRCIICHQPDWFLNKLDFLLCTNHFIAAHYTMIHQELLRAAITAKKLKGHFRMQWRCSCRLYSVHGSIRPRTAWLSGWDVKGQAHHRKALWPIRKGNLCCSEGCFCERKNFSCRGFTNGGWSDLTHGCWGVHNKGDVPGIFGALCHMPCTYFIGFWSSFPSATTLLTFPWKAQCLMLWQCMHPPWRRNTQTHRTIW